MILLIDNYDSFTYNLYQYLLMLGEEAVVYRNDELNIRTLEFIDPDLIIISPGPGRPEAAGISIEVVNVFKAKIPILGICLGMQVIAQCLGGNIVKAIEPVHGKVRPIIHRGKNLFEGIPNPLMVTRYHSLVVEKTSITRDFAIDAESGNGEIMAISHKTLPLWGVQFHPEAELTECGMQLLSNALFNASLCKAKI